MSLRKTVIVFLQKCVNLMHMTKCWLNNETLIWKKATMKKRRVYQVSTVSKLILILSNFNLKKEIIKIKHLTHLYC